MQKIINNRKRFVALNLALLILSAAGSFSLSARAGDDRDMQSVVEMAGAGSPSERLSRITQSRAGWPSDAQAAEEFKILRASQKFEPFRALSHTERGEEVARIRRVLAPLFELHGGSTLIISVLRTPRPVFGIGRGSVLLISSGLLQVLSDEELLALSAHEVGHQYFRREFARAEDAGDSRALRIIELKCDAIAVLSLLILNRKPASLARGLAWVKGPAYEIVAGDTSTHPDLGVRQRLIARLAP